MKNFRLYFVFSFCLFLFYTVTLKAISLITPDTLYRQGNAIVVTYSGMPGYDTDRLAIYRDYGDIPLKKSRVAPGVSGQLSLGSDLLPGIYHVVYEKADGTSVGDTLTFKVVSDFVPVSGGIRIGVISDTHLMAPDLLLKDGSAFQKYLEHDRKLLLESKSIAETTVKKMLEEKVNMVLVSGDLTKDGELLSHELFVKLFHPLIDAGIKVVVTPGNHDIRNPNAMYFDGDTTHDAANVSSEDFARIYQDYGYGQAVSRDTASLSYVTEPIAGLRIFVIDGCEYDKNKAVRDGADKNKMVSDGYVKPSTLEWMKEQARIARDEGDMMLGLEHHSLIEHFNNESLVAESYLYSNRQKVQQAYLDAGIPMVFTGHFHSSDIKKVSDGTNYVYDIGTGAMCTYPCLYRIMDINKERTTAHIETKYIDHVDCPTDGLSFTDYAKNKLRIGIPQIINYGIRTYYDSIQSNIPEILSYLVKLPDVDTLVQLVDNNLVPSLSELQLTYNEGNENLKECQPLIDSLDSGLDVVLGSLVAIPAMKGVLLQLCKSLPYYNLIQDGLKSLAFNTIVKPSALLPTQKEDPLTVYNDTINDYFLSLDLSFIKAAIKDCALSASPFSVYPHFSEDGKVNIRVPDTTSDDVCILNASGKCIAVIRTVDSGRCLSYQFAEPGFYLVRCGRYCQKVLVR